MHSASRPELGSRKGEGRGLSWGFLRRFSTYHARLPHVELIIAPSTRPLPEDPADSAALEAEVQA